MRLSDEAVGKFIGEPYIDLHMRALDLAEEDRARAKEAGLSGYQLSVAYMEAVKVRLGQADPGRRSRCFVYFAFFGEGGAASRLKVGVSRSPAFRMSGLSTGNPLGLLWVYAVEFGSRKEAMRHERLAHKHLRESWVRGEWFSVCGIDEAEARRYSLELKKFTCDDLPMFEVQS